MGRKNVEFKQTAKAKKKYALEVDGKVYNIRNHNLLVLGTAMDELELMRVTEGLEQLKHLTNAIKVIYGQETYTRIMEDDLIDDWDNFIGLSIALAAGQTPEEYWAEINKKESEEEASKKDDEA